MKSIILAAITALSSAEAINGQTRLQVSPEPIGSLGKRMKISARSEVSVEHTAELAEIEIGVHSCHASRSQAKDQTTSHLEALSSRFSSLGLNITQAYPVSINSAEDDEWDWMAGGRYNRKSWKDSSSSKNKDDEDEESFCGTSTLTVSVSDLSLLPQFSTGNLSTSTADARVDYIDWTLTCATKAAQKSSLRRKALQEMKAIGDDYAEVFGVESVTMVGLEEYYGYDEVAIGGKGRRWSLWRDAGEAVDLSVPELSTTAEFSFEFRV